VKATKGTHAHFSWLRHDFKLGLEEAANVEENGDVDEMQVKQCQVICIYLLYLVGVMLLTNNSVNGVDVTFLKCFYDLELIINYA
jgi:hypothetical protein